MKRIAVWSIMVLRLLVTENVAVPAGKVLAESHSLKPIWELATPRQWPLGIQVDQQTNKHLFVAMKSGGLVVYKLNEKGIPPREIARLPIAHFGKQEVMGLTQRKHYLYLALGDFFDAKGSPAGLAIVDVKNPAMPAVVSLWISPGKQRGAAGIVVDQHFAYLAAMTAGVMIFDISNPKIIRHTSTYQPNIHFPKKNPSRVQHPNARGLVIVGNLLYLAYDSGGLRILDVSNRAAPKEIGRYINARMGAKQQAYNNLVVDGNQVFAAIDYAGLEMLDVRQPRAIRQIAWWNPWKANTLNNLWFNSPGHTNQIVLDRKQQRVYLSAGDSGLQVVDVSNPQKPALLNHFGKPKDGKGVWAVTHGRDVTYLGYIEAVIPFRGKWAGIVAVK